jgi:tetratricopeptide (TPR) repeat protein
MENFFLEIKKVLFFNPGHEESLLFLAMLYAANDMYSNAINSFTKILQADPENREALFYSALCCLSLNEKEKGEALLNSLLSITPEDSDTLTILGYLKKPVDIDKAIDFFKGAIKSETGFDLMDYASLFYAVCLMKKGEYDTAYQELSKLEPFSESKPLDYKSELYFSLAWAAHKNGKPVLSEKWWEKLVGFNFTYLDLFGQYKIHNLLSFEMVNKKWNDMFKNMTIPALKLLLARYKGLNIKNMESEFDNWSLGKRQKGKGKIKNVTCYTIEEFINLNFNELLSFSKKIIETMSYRVDTEIDNKSGYDCITQPDLNGNCHYVQIRNWNSIVSDVPIKELYNLMEKKNVPKGILVTSGTFTQKAQKAAMDLGISLIDKNELKTLMF